MEFIVIETNSKSVPIYPKKSTYRFITTIGSRNPKYFDGKSKICKQISIRNLPISVAMI